MGRLRPSFTAFTVLLAASLAFQSQPGLAASRDIAELTGGRTQLRLNTHVLADLGVALYPTTESLSVGDADELGTGEFEILETSVLGLSLPNGSYRGPVTGYLVHQGGLELRWDGGRVSLSGFELHPALPPEVFELRAADGSVVFFLDNPHPQPSLDGREFLLLDMDLRLSEQLAQRLGSPELVGMAVGEAHVRSRFVDGLVSGRGSAADEPNGGACVADFNGPVDVQLETMTSVAETYHDSQRVAFAPSVSLKNVGTADVRWFRSIAPDGNPPLDVVGEHPFLVMNLYRTANGRIEQIGRSDIKHAFFSANTPPCNCQPDQVLFNDCTDVYSAGTNAHRKFLAPRTEVDASTGMWTSTGSHFDGPLPDDLRGHDEPDHPDQFEHRLSAAVADLVTPAAEYRVEAWYLVKDDVDIFNSMGHRRVAPSLIGTWVFPFADVGLKHGSVLDSWVDPQALPPDSSNVVITTNPHEGRLQLASQTSLLPGGIYHYEFALMNFDFDRQIDSFSVPLPAAGPDPLLVQNVWFGDGDADSGNDWQAAVTGSEIRWAAPVGGALDWGTLFNFSFDINSAPADLQISLGVLEVGSPASLTAIAVGPVTLIPAAEIEVALTGSGVGQVTSLPPGIECGTDCNEIVAQGEHLAFSAASSAGSAFAGWEESAATVSRDLTYDVVVGGGLELTAVFELCQNEVVLSAETVVEPTLFYACNSIAAGNGFHVATDVIFRSGQIVALSDGFRVDADSNFRAELAPEQAVVPVQ